MAHKKAGGSTRNGRDSEAKRLGVKMYGGQVIVPGEAGNWIAFDVSQGLEALRELTQDFESDCGIELIGAVGLTSHVADIVRRARIPTRIRATA